MELYVGKIEMNYFYCKINIFEKYKIYKDENVEILKYYYLELNVIKYL